MKLFQEKLQNRVIVTKRQRRTAARLKARDARSNRARSCARIMHDACAMHAHRRGPRMMPARARTHADARTPIPQFFDSTPRLLRATNLRDKKQRF